MDGNSVSRDGSRKSAAISDRRSDRDIDAILRRRRERKKKRRYDYPPDMMHGRVPIGKIYKVLGRRWPENTGFVDAVRNSQGDLLAWSVGAYDARFLRIQQATMADTDDPANWMAKRLSDKSRLLIRVGNDGVPTHLTGAIERRSGASMTQLPCATDMLQALESRHLAVTRDFSISGHEPGGRREPRLRASRLNILSMIGLCAVWTQ